MAVQMCAGVWRRRDGVTVTVRSYKEDCGWMGTDGHHRWDDGHYAKGAESDLDLVAFVSLPEQPQAQPDAAEELAAVKDDRDRWTDRKSTRLNSSHSSVSRMPSSA